MQKIYFSFSMMRFRMKISFEACKQHKTIKEFILQAILRAYQERRNKGLVENPYPEVTKQMIEGIRNLHIKNFTSKTMKEEAKQKERDRLREASKKRQSGIQSLDFPDQNKEGQVLENQTQMFKVLSKSILTKDGIDDLFEKLYESEDENDPQDDKALELYVKESEYQADFDPDKIHVKKEEQT